jgi:two-component system, chemotaxis family, chemotaxis protein CheY
METILVIDDEPAMRQMIRGILESAAYRVIEAPNGTVGLAQFRDHRPCLVITDILMPDKDGIQAVKELRKFDPEARIIAISGGGRAKYMNFLAIAKEFGAAESLSKPFRRDELLASVTRVLGAKGQLPN